MPVSRFTCTLAAIGFALLSGCGGSSSSHRAPAAAPGTVAKAAGPLSPEEAVAVYLLGTTIQREVIFVFDEVTETAIFDLLPADFDPAQNNDNDCPDGGRLSSRHYSWPAQSDYWERSGWQGHMINTIDFQLQDCGADGLITHGSLRYGLSLAGDHSDKGIHWGSARAPFEHRIQNSTQSYRYQTWGKLHLEADHLSSLALHQQQDLIITDPLTDETSSLQAILSVRGFQNEPLAQITTGPDDHPAALRARIGRRHTLSGEALTSNMPNDCPLDGWVDVMAEFAPGSPLEQGEMTIYQQSGDITVYQRAEKQFELNHRGESLILDQDAYDEAQRIAESCFFAIF